MARSLPMILGLAAAGAFGALVAAVILKEQPPATAPPEDVSRLDARFDELAGQIERLHRQVQLIQDAPPLPDAPDREVRATAASAEQGELAPPESLPDASLPPDELETRVREVLRKTREEEREARGQRWANWAQDRQKSMLDRLAENHGLTAYQRGEMEKLLATRREAIGSYHRVRFSASAADEGADLNKLRQAAESARTETDEAIKSLLSADQYEAYKKEEEASRLGGMGGRGRGGSGR